MICAISHGIFLKKRAERNGEVRNVMASENERAVKETQFVEARRQ